MRSLHFSILLFSYKGYDASPNGRKLKSDSVASCSISPTLHLKRQTYSNNLAIYFAFENYTTHGDLAYEETVWEFYSQSSVDV